MPITGRTRKIGSSAPDVEHKQLALEIKTREVLPKWLQNARDQALACRKAGQLPVVVLHEKGKRVKNCLALVALADLMELIPAMNTEESLNAATEDEGST